MLSTSNYAAKNNAKQNQYKLGVGRGFMYKVLIAIGVFSTFAYIIIITIIITQLFFIADQNLSQFFFEVCNPRNVHVKWVTGI